MQPVIRKAFHSLFLGIFLIYTVAPLWYEVDDSDTAFEIAATAGSTAPRLLFPHDLISSGRSAADRHSLSANSEEDGNGILLKKKRGILSSKKMVEPPSAELVPAAPPRFLDDKFHLQPISPDKPALLAAFSYYHSGSSPPLS